MLHYSLLIQTPSFYIDGMENRTTPNTNLTRKQSAIADSAVFYLDSLPLGGKFDLRRGDRLGGLGERRQLPQRGLGQSPSYWLGGLGERYELPQRGLGRSPSRKRILVYFRDRKRILVYFRDILKRFEAGIVGNLSLESRR